MSPIYCLYIYIYKQYICALYTLSHCMIYVNDYELSGMVSFSSHNIKTIKCKKHV